MTDLLGLVPESARAALGAWLAERGEPPYRTRQILPRLWQRPVASWEAATELPERLRRAFVDCGAGDAGLTQSTRSRGLGTGGRHIAGATAGILPNVAELAQRPEQFRRALSLHAPTPEVRHELMPIEKKYGLPAVI